MERSERVSAEWSSRTFREALASHVRRRVPERDAEDVVQAVLLEAVASPRRPAAPDEARRWIWTVARNKIADYHRRERRVVFDSPEPIGDGTADAIDDLLRWAVGELPPGEDARSTLAWLVREADGETLEDIARSEELPPAKVRQRVSRLRRMFRSKWALVAAAAGLTALILYVATRTRGHVRRTNDPRAPVLQLDPDDLARLDRARTLRRDALQACDAARWAECVRGLDAARTLDPRGDDAPALRAAREAARQALERPDAQNAPPPTPAIPRESDRSTRGSSLGVPSSDSTLGSSLGVSSSDSTLGSSRRRRARRPLSLDASSGP